MKEGLGKRDWGLVPGGSSFSSFAFRASSFDFSRRERRQARECCPPVVGAHVLADVAAEDVSAHTRTELIRDGIAQLDGQIAQAAPRVHDIRLDECARRAGLEAERAGAASV